MMLASNKKPWPMRKLAIVILLSWLQLLESVNSVLGDGLLFKLPSDGTVAEFRADGTAVMQFVLPEATISRLPKAERERVLSKNEIKSSGTVAISVVGRERHALLDYRWIELTRGEDKAGNGTSLAVLKVLVPEERCSRGFHPLDHALLTFFNPKKVDENKRLSPDGFNRLQYELDRFLPVFPPPLTNEMQGEQRTVETAAGVFRDCKTIVGTSDFDRFLLGNGRWAMKTEWSIALHDDAPFGVVELQSRSAGREINEDGNYVTVEMTNKLTLIRVGNDAKATPNGNLRGH